MLTHVVSKYNEDISWIDQYRDIKYIIYCKDNIFYKEDVYKNVKLDNIWRESHTFLEYIITHYHSLSDFTLFSQGWIFDHISKKMLLRFYNEEKYTWFMKHFFDVDFRIHYWKGDIKPNYENMTLKQWAIKNIDKDIQKFIDQNWYFVSYWAVMKVPKENILSRPLDFYIHLQKKLIDINPEEWHFLERLWYYVFNFHKQEILENPDYLIVWSWLSWCVVAQQLAQTYPKTKILIIEKRNHIWGNCYDYIDENTNIRVSKYGAHIFHTNSKKVFKYIQKFSNWIPFDHKVQWKNWKSTFPLPININTINSIFKKNISSSIELRVFLKTLRDPNIKDPKNGEEYCLMKFWKEIYEKIFFHYSIKQWWKSPKELSPDIFKRIPIRYNTCDSYFTDRYVVLPEDGYTNFINNMTDYNNIWFLFSTAYENFTSKSFKQIFFTWPIDHYYRSMWMQNLEYRSLCFEMETIKDIWYFQDFPVVNYTWPDEKYTRIVEYKYFNNKHKSRDTIISKEFSTSSWEPYYPVNTAENIALYNYYNNLSMNEKNIIFLWRLANYKYFNMDEAILNSLVIVKNFIRNK